MGKTQSISHQPMEGSPGGEFEKFSELPYDLRLLIWKNALPEPRIVEVKEVYDKQNKQCWISACHPPTISRVSRESRDIALRHYSFSHSTEMEIFLDPDIDTLYFGPTENEWAFLEFLTKAKLEHVRHLKNLALNEMHLAVWSHSITSTKSSISPILLSSALMGLERLMIGVQLENPDHPHPAKLHSDEWPGWLFEGGPPTMEERSILLGAKQELLFSAHSIDGLIFHIWSHKPGQGPDYSSYAGSMSLAEVMDDQRLHKLFRENYHLEHVDAHSRNPNLNHYRTARPDDVSSWCRKIYWRVAKTDFRVKRMFAKHQRDNADSGESWIPPRVACFSRPEGSLLPWVTCIQSFCDIEWSSVQDLSRFEIEGRRDLNGEDIILEGLQILSID